MHLSQSGPQDTATTAGVLLTLTLRIGGWAIYQSPLQYENGAQLFSWNRLVSLFLLNPS